LHPIAWWLWALALGAAALRTTNIVLLSLLIAVAWLVVASRRVNAPWARSFAAFARLGALIIVIRVLLEIFFGQRLPGTELFSVPQVELPSWAAGVTLGGPVTTESLVAAFAQGLQLAALLICVGAANSLASPYRLLRAIPSVLYELGVVVTVGLSFAPQATMSATRVRDARRLRGRSYRGVRGLRGLAVPVLEGALEHSLELAASMDSRGYGRRGVISPARRRVAQAATLGGVGVLMVGVFAVLDSGAPFVLGIPMLALGALALAASLAATKANATRSRYRPDLWRAPEWCTVLAGAAALGAFVLAGHLGVELKPAYSPLQAPSLPLLPAVGALLATIPAFATPPVPVDAA
jgi:energy-coupling factor transport system permease protein